MAWRGAVLPVAKVHAGTCTRFEHVCACFTSITTGHDASTCRRSQRPLRRTHRALPPRHHAPPAHPTRHATPHHTTELSYLFDLLDGNSCEGRVLLRCVCRLHHAPERPLAEHAHHSILLHGGWMETREVLHPHPLLCELYSPRTGSRGEGPPLEMWRIWTIQCRGSCDLSWFPSSSLLLVLTVLSVLSSLRAPFFTALDAGMLRGEGTRSQSLD